MNCILNEATFAIAPKTDDECDIDLWFPTDTDCMPGERGASVKVQPWFQEMIEELAISSGMVGDKWGEAIYQNQTKSLNIISSIGMSSKHFINDPEIERALDVWREQDDMDDISEPSYFTQWDQSLNGTTWVSDGNPNNLWEPTLLTPEMLQQTDKLNILWDEEGAHYRPRGQLLPDQLVTLEVLAIGDKHGVAKCAYGGVFLTKGTLTYLQRGGGINIGDKFNCWITFTNAKYPWRTVVNGVVN
jgi:hypothetical protein